MSARYWVGVISKEHAMRGVAGSFIQVCHGKQAPLKRMKKGDWILIYSSKQAMQGTEKCQSFTAIGQVTGNDVYQFKMSEDFVPFRRDIAFLACNETSILPLINHLDFIPNKKLWGFPFRFGFFEIKEHDFQLIHTNMLAHEECR